MSTADYDILIVGGGMVGASLAAALSQVKDTHLRIAVVESTAFASTQLNSAQSNSQQHPSFDARTVAVSDSSKVIFQTLGLWDEILALGAMPIKRIHVSDRGHMGSTHMDARQQGVAALGYVVETQVIGKVLNHYIDKSKNIDLICPATVESFTVVADLATVSINRDGQSETVQAKLVVAADGGDSRLRQLAGIKTLNMNYGQSAVIANVACDRVHQNIAYERFTDSGPMALLPGCDPDCNDSGCNDSGCSDKSYALVWTEKPKQAEVIAALDDDAFLHRLQKKFGRRAGNFIKAGSRTVYPLKFQQARESVRPRLAIIGNAAHSLHPVSGQGFNLGLRDVAVLAQLIVDTTRSGEDPGVLENLQDYARWRRRDQWQTALSTDSLVRIFSNNFLPLALARNLGLLALDILPPLKKRLARHAMGYIGKQPRLSRGLPL